MTFMDMKNNVVKTGHARTCTGQQIHTTQTMAFEHGRMTCNLRVRVQQLPLQVLADLSL